MHRRYDALVATSTSAERVHAVGRAVDEVRGAQHDETRAGLVLARINGLSAWLSTKEAGEVRTLLHVSRKAARRALKQTIRGKRRALGLAKREAREVIALTLTLTLSP